ncbi:hypothetical protein F4780DRAFT_388218 [Xylariomycetidae sp. FL0641]|nr:hypothetical protein F4780DRAFT_388218 [Xylariomycetidae sp. FL0641]
MVDLWHRLVFTVLLTVRLLPALLFFRNPPCAAQTRQKRYLAPPLRTSRRYLPSQIRAKQHLAIWASQYRRHRHRA